MPLLRSLFALGASFLLVLAGATSAAAAFQTVQLSTTSAPVGTAITMHVEISGLLATENPTALYVVPKGALGLDGDHSASHCEDVTGATIVGELLWDEAPIAFEGSTYPGFVADVAFTVPEVPLGIYDLAMSVEAEGTGCHQFAQFGVGVELPDTAIGQPPSFPIAGILLAALAFMFVGRARRAHR